jgi:hypothetical protein
MVKIYTGQDLTAPLYDRPDNRHPNWWGLANADRIVISSEVGVILDLSDILHAFRQVGRTNSSSTYKESVAMTRLHEHQVKRGSKRRALFWKPKKNSKPTKNWCCQSFHAEGNTKEEISALTDGRV